MTQKSPILELIDVSKIYTMGEESLYALNKINLKIMTGEFVAILGKSGSGKSTMMNMMGVLDKPSEGQVLLKGENISLLDSDKLADFRGRSIGFIFQQYNLIPRLTAYENVKLSLDFLDYDEEKAEIQTLDALKSVDLTDKINHLPTQLSGGQQQRVSIARSLVAKPAIILADEPTGALDSKTGHDVMHILNSLWKENKTVIMITHDLNLAKFASRIVEISDGKIVKDYINKNKQEI